MNAGCRERENKEGENTGSGQPNAEPVNGLVIHIDKSKLPLCRPGATLVVVGGRAVQLLSIARENMNLYWRMSPE